MTQLNEIVSIILTREGTEVSTASFQIPLVLATFTNFMERARIYTGLTSVADDFDSTDNVYKIAQALFGQSTNGAVPPSIVVGRRQVSTIQLDPVVADNTLYTVVINGTTYSYTSATAATATTIAAGLDTAVGVVAGINFTAATGVITVAPTVPGTDYSLSVSANLTRIDTATESWVDALDAVTQVNDEWYAMVAETHVEADVVALSGAIQARRKMYGTSSQDVAVPTTATTDIASQLNLAGNGRTFGVYLPTADTQFPEAAWIGSQLSYTPGSNDWALKRASGVTVAKLTDTQRSNLTAKNMNYFTRFAGATVFRQGDMFDGFAIDALIVEDWLYARLQEGIFFRLINSLKVPMTNKGLAIIENEIRAVLAQAERNGAIDTGWTVSVPDVLDIPANLRAQRIAGAFTFRCRSAASIRKVNIEGFIGI